jgi:hypothetical protein
VLERWRETLILREGSLDKRGWLIEVMRCAERIGRAAFGIGEAYAFSRIWSGSIRGTTMSGRRSGSSCRCCAITAGSSSRGGGATGCAEGCNLPSGGGWRASSDGPWPSPDPRPRPRATLSRSGRGGPSPARLRRVGLSGDGRGGSFVGSLSCGFMRGPLTAASGRRWTAEPFASGGGF